MPQEKARAIVFIADGFEEIEAITVIDILRRAEIETLAVSIMGRIEAIGAHGVKLLCDYELEESGELINAAEALIFPGGGGGTDVMKNHPLLKDIVIEADKNGKLLAAICAAPSFFGKSGILNGRDAVCYPGCENELIGARVSKENVVVSENVVTGKAAGCSHEFAFKIVELLSDKSGLDGKKTASRIRERMYYF